LATKNFRSISIGIGVQLCAPRYKYNKRWNLNTRTVVENWGGGKQYLPPDPFERCPLCPRLCCTTRPVRIAGFYEFYPAPCLGAAFVCCGFRSQVSTPGKQLPEVAARGR